MQTSTFTLAGLDTDYLIRSAMERIRQLEAEVRRLQGQPEQTEGSIQVFQGSRLIKVDLREILYIQAESNYSRIHLDRGEQYCTSRTLKSWADALAGQDFLRCHRSYLVNQKKIVEIDRRHHAVILKGGVSITISRRFQRSSVQAVFQNKSPRPKRSVGIPDGTVRQPGLRVA